MSHPKIVPDLLTLMVLWHSYPNGFATPHLKAGMPYCLDGLMTNDVMMNMFKQQVRYPRNDAEKLMLLWEGPNSVLDAFPDRPGVTCACGKGVSWHKGGEHYRGDKP